LILREVFKGVAGRVGNFLCGFVVVFACELAAVDDGGIVDGLVAALGLEILDLADDALAVDDFAEDDVLVVEMGCRDGGDEELRAVRSWISLVYRSLTFSC